MKSINPLLLFILLFISNIGYSSQVIPPGALLEIIAQEKGNLKTNWVIESSELMKNSSKKELEMALKLLKDIDIKSIDSNLWENKTQKVKTKSGFSLEVTFSYTEYGPNDIMLAGVYTLVSVKKAEATIIGKQFLGSRGNSAKILLGKENCSIGSSGNKEENSFLIEFSCNGITQLLFDTEAAIEGGRNSVDDPLFSLLWAGDKDNDGKIDIVMEMSPKYSYSKKITYLSSKAKDGQLVGIATTEKNEPH